VTTIDDIGFHRTRLDQRLADLKSAYLAVYGSDCDLSPESPDGQIIAAWAEVIADHDELLEAVYNGRSAAGARGAALSRLAQLNGVTRHAASFSIVDITLTGTNGTLVPAGSLISTTETPAATFATVADVTIGASPTAGQARATASGPVHAPAGTLTNRLTVIAGWTGVTNAADASIGSFEETDAELRARRLASVALPSQGILDGLFAALAQVDDVSHVAVYENPSDSVDSDGLPPHSVNAVVDGGSAADIALAMWTHKSLGVTLVGAQTQDVPDTQGIAHAMRWDVPAPTLIYVTVQLASTVGSSTKSAIRDAVAAYGDANSQIGGDVIWSQLFIPVNSVPGLNVLAIFVGTAPSPATQANVVIAFNAIARWDISRIDVTP